MTAQEIKSLPKEFYFKSQNRLVDMYHAVETDDCYIVTIDDDDCRWTYDKPEFHRKLLNGEFVVIEKGRLLTLEELKAEAKKHGYKLVKEYPYIRLSQGGIKMLKVGTRVRYIHEDTEDEKKTGYYPPIGTCGTVVYADDLDTFQVKWDEGTDGDGIWWCETESVEVITE